MPFHTIRQFAAVALKKVISSVGTAPSSGNCICSFEMEDTTDSSANSYTFTATGATSGATGIIADAYNFDGTSDYLTSDLDIGDFASGDFTINIWINPDTIVSARAFLDTTNVVSTHDVVARYNSTSGDVYFRTQVAGTVVSVVSTDQLSTGSWQMVTLVRESGDLSIYIDAGTVKTTSATAGNLSSVGDMIIGANKGLSQGVDAQIDEVTVWDTALTADNVTYLYQLGNPGTAQQYPFT